MGLSLVESPLELERPDVVILLDSKSTVLDIRTFQGAGMTTTLHLLTA